MEKNKISLVQDELFQVLDQRVLEEYFRTLEQQVEALFGREKVCFELEALVE